MSVITTIAKDSTKYEKILSNHQTLLVTISKQDISLVIPSVSFLKINALTGEVDIGIEKILYSTFIDDNHDQTLTSQSQFNIYENIMKVLQIIKYYNIYTAKVQLLPDEIRSNLSIKVSTLSMQKTMKMITIPWIEFINYFSIQIRLHDDLFRKKERVKSEADLRLERILNRLSLYSFIFENEHVVDISLYSLKKIIKLKDEGLYSLAKVLSLVIIHYQEYQAKVRRSRKIRDSSNIMLIKEEVGENEKSFYCRIRTTDYSTKLQKLGLNKLEMHSKQASDVLQGLRNKVCFKKKSLEEYSKSNNSFIYVTTANGQKHFIRKTILMEIADNKEKYVNEVVTVQNIFGEDVRVNKAKHQWKDEKEYVYLLNADKSTILIEKEKFNTLLSKLKAKSQMDEIVNKINNKNMKCNLYNMRIPDARGELDEAKFKLRNIVNATDSTMIEVEKNQLISYFAYENIMSSYNDEFKIVDCLDDSKKLVMTKKKLQGFLLKEEYCYIKIKSQGKEFIVLKSELLNMISQAKDFEKVIALKDYNEKEVVVKLNDIHIVSLSEEIEDLNMPDEIKKAQTRKSAIAMDIVMKKESMRPEASDEVFGKEEQYEVEHEFTNESIEQLRIPSPEKPKMKKKSKNSSSGQGTLIYTRVYKRTRIKD